MNILVTGGTGSLGHALAQALLNRNPEHKLIVLSRDEQKHNAMSKLWPMDEYPVRYLVGDVRDQDRLVRAMEGVDWVIHAAAMKIVPICEHNPWEAVQTNVQGTWNVIRACLQTGVKRAILVSTDKAVQPVNLYGATKLTAEKLFVHANVYGGVFSAVRYGNVMGSRGSVLPLFRECVMQDMPFPITDREMTRFWLTLPEAVEFVMSSLSRAVGGEVFVPKLRSCRIVDLALALRSEGFFDEIGIRPGEKLHETLVSGDEHPVIDAGDRLVVLPQQFPRDELQEWFKCDSWPRGRAYTSSNCPQIPMKELRRMVNGE
jgi:UDP-N-acetylglucosamine 4,6-dehydratase